MTHTRNGTNSFRDSEEALFPFVVPWLDLSSSLFFPTCHLTAHGPLLGSERTGLHLRLRHDPSGHVTDHVRRAQTVKSTGRGYGRPYSDWTRLGRRSRGRYSVRRAGAQSLYPRRSEGTSLVLPRSGDPVDPRLPLPDLFSPLSVLPPLAS